MRKRDCKEARGEKRAGGDREKERKVSSITAPHPVSAHQVDLVTRGDTAPTNCAAPFDTRHPMSQKGDSAGQLAALPALAKQNPRLSLGNIACSSGRSRRVGRRRSSPAGVLTGGHGRTLAAEMARQLDEQFAACEHLSWTVETILKSPLSTVVVTDIAVSVTFKLNTFGLRRAHAITKPKTFLVAWPLLLQVIALTVLEIYTASEYT